MYYKNTSKTIGIEFITRLHHLAGFGTIL